MEVQCHMDIVKACMLTIIKTMLFKFKFSCSDTTYVLHPNDVLLHFDDNQVYQVDMDTIDSPYIQVYLTKLLS